jgi:hypothetical protein
MDAAMSGTKRIPIYRQARPRLTAKAIELFRQMKPLHRLCTCAPPPPNQLWKKADCPACCQWYDLQAEWHTELGGKPWNWPIIRQTLAECEGGQRELWQELEAASKAARASLAGA